MNITHEIYAYSKYTSLALIKKEKIEGDYISECELCDCRKNAYLQYVGDDNFVICLDCLDKKIETFKKATEGWI